MSIVALKAVAPEREFGRYSICSERLIEQARVFDDLAASDDADREARDASDNYAGWLEGRAAAYRHAAKVIRRTVDMFSYEDA